MRRLFHAATTITVALFFEDANKKSRVSKKNRAIPRTFPVRNGFFPARGRSGAEKGGGRPREKDVLGGKTRLRNGENRAGRAENRWGVAAGRFRGRVPGRCGMPAARPGRGGRGAAMPRSHRQRAALVRAGEGGWHGRRGLRAGRAGGAFGESAARAVPLPGRGVRGGRRRRTACLCRAHACVMRFSAAGPEEGSFFVRCRAEGLQISFPVLTGRREFRILKQRTVTL